jgi:hypothetical protein
MLGAMGSTYSLLSGHSIDKTYECINFTNKPRLETTEDLPLFSIQEG